MMKQPRFSDEALGGSKPSAEDPLARLRLELTELQAHLRQQWAARTDRVLLGMRRWIALATVAILALLALVAWVVTAVILLLAGVTGGLATVLHGRFWLAGIIVGVGAIALLAVSLAALYAGWHAVSRRRTRQKYERARREQRRQFGHSAHERATRT